MRSQNQIDASRRNGAQSRGPVTEIGKATSAQNSTKHGLCSREVVLTNEDPQAWESTRQTFLLHWQPTCEMEILMVDDLDASQWKLLRAESMETSILNAEMDILQPEIEKTFHRIDEPTRQAISIKSLADHSAVLAQLDRHQTRLARQFDRTWKRLDQLRRDRPAPAIEQTPVVDQNVQNEPEPEPQPAAPEQPVQNEPKPQLVAEPTIDQDLQNEPADEIAEDPRRTIIERILNRPSILLDRSARFKP